MLDWLKQSKILWLVTISIVGGFILIKSLEPAPVAIAPKSLPNSCIRSVRERDNVRILINEARLKEGLEQMPDSQLLKDYAEFRLNEMTTTDNYSHDTAKEFWPWVRENQRIAEGSYFEAAGGEVLHSNPGDTCTVINEILASPTHRDILLKGDLMGIAINYKYLVVITGAKK